MNPYRENIPGDDQSDKELREVLRALPREKAGAELKASVLRRVAAAAGAGSGARVLRFRPEERRPFPVWSGWVMAAAALLLLGLGVREWQHRREAFEAMQRIAELRGQYQELSRELAELRHEAAARSERPVVFLGGNEKVDLVLDLGRLAEAQKKLEEDPEARRKAKEELDSLYRQGEGAKIY